MPLIVTKMCQYKTMNWQCTLYEIKSGVTTINRNRLRDEEELAHDKLKFGSERSAVGKLTVYIVVWWL